MRLAERFATVSLVALLSGCVTTPNLNSVWPGSGYSRQLLAVYGDTGFASVVWDPGLPSETLITNGLVGTTYFQIPTNVSPGPHKVALRNSGGTSAPQTVYVLPCTEPLVNSPLATGSAANRTAEAAPQTPAANAAARIGIPTQDRCGPFPAPRIEDIAILRLNTITNPQSVVFTISAANLDTDATVSIAILGNVTGCARWGGMPIEYMQSHVPITFAYPVYHYAQLICPLQNITLGQTLAVTVTNKDGLSDTANLALPDTEAELDSDNDSIPDLSELRGLAGVDLPAMGAEPLRKNIFVETDWTAAGRPNNLIWLEIEHSFRNAPVLNPDGSAGIDIIIDHGQGGPFRRGGEVLTPHFVMDFEAPDVLIPSFPPFPSSSNYLSVSFETYKRNHFDSRRFPVFHYAVFGRARPNGSSGRGEIWGNDFMVTFATKSEWPYYYSQAGTFIHELGHNLGLGHSGLFPYEDDVNDQLHSPVSPSILNYRYQFVGVSADCDFNPEYPTATRYAYSQGMLASINERSVNEAIGICDRSPLDLNRDNAIGTGVMNTNSSPNPNNPLDTDTFDTHVDSDQWGNLKFDLDAPNVPFNPVD